MRISDWSSDVCSSDLERLQARRVQEIGRPVGTKRPAHLVHHEYQDVGPPAHRGSPPFSFACRGRHATKSSATHSPYIAGCVVACQFPARGGFLRDSTGGTAVV